MDMSRTDFLPSVIGILERLSATSAENGASNLAFLLDLARNEAEDELRTGQAQDRIRTTLKDTSCATSLAPAARLARLERSEDPGQQQPPADQGRPIRPAKAVSRKSRGKVSSA